MYLEQIWYDAKRNLNLQLKAETKEEIRLLNDQKLRWIFVKYELFKKDIQCDILSEFVRINRENVEVFKANISFSLNFDEMRHPEEVSIFLENITLVSQDKKSKIDLKYEMPLSEITNLQIGNEIPESLSSSTTSEIESLDGTIETFLKDPTVAFINNIFEVEPSLEELRQFFDEKMHLRAQNESFFSLNRILPSILADIGLIIKKSCELLDSEAQTEIHDFFSRYLLTSNSV